MKKQQGPITVECISPCTMNGFEVIVFDADNRTVFHGKTARNGTASFDVHLPGEYRIRVCAKGCLNPQAATRWLFLYPDRLYTAYFLFNPLCLNPGFTMVKFRLTDRNYGGLSIQKGVIQLCRVPILSILPKAQVRAEF